MVIEQGDVYWLDLPTPSGQEPGYRRPHVVVQNNTFNQSGIRTVVVCALTSNIDLARAPGNVLLKPGEGNLAKQSVVNVSQIFAVDKSFFEDRIGTLRPARVREIIAGITLLLRPSFLD